jgi:hypothetical protein
MREEWEDRADIEKAAAIAKDHGGIFRRVGSPPTATAAQ